MNRLLIILLIACVFCSCYLTRLPKNEPIAKHISEYILANCQENYPCTIRLKDATDFSWDKLYVFDIAIENDVITKMVGTTKFTSSGDYSRKWFFVKDDQVVRFEEHILSAVDEPVANGSVLLEEGNPKEKYSIFSQDAAFEVVKNKLSDDEHYYYLTCINCN